MYVLNSKEFRNINELISIQCKAYVVKEWTRLAQEMQFASMSPRNILLCHHSPDDAADRSVDKNVNRQRAVTS